jgi:hypothetical protein
VARFVAYCFAAAGREEVWVGAYSSDYTGRKEDSASVLRTYEKPSFLVVQDGRILTSTDGAWIMQLHMHWRRRQAAASGGKGTGQGGRAAGGGAAARSSTAPADQGGQAANAVARSREGAGVAAGKRPLAREAVQIKKKQRLGKGDKEESTSSSESGSSSSSPPVKRKKHRRGRKHGKGSRRK